MHTILRVIFAVSVPSSGLLLLLCGAMLLSCGNNRRTFGAEPKYGGKPVKVASLLNPEQHGKTVAISGEIRAVCQTEGCWISLYDGTAAVGVMFADAGFTAPTDCTGKSATVEGKMTERLFTAADAEKFTLEAGDGHEFCLLGEDNCGSSHARKTRATTGKISDRRVQVFIATSLTINN